MDSAQTTRAAVAGISMAFLSIVLLSLGRTLFGWGGFLLAIVVIALTVRGLQPMMVRWIRGGRS